MSLNLRVAWRASRTCSEFSASSCWPPAWCACEAAGAIAAQATVLSVIAANDFHISTPSVGVSSA